ncbi:uncharacterized protein TM35_000411100 [Trypanosoma theileri]|uniref:Uncharacterized protein n=1 Tax=Trypanosoma theileri TaxID=67003 RepID=A0A1X0NKV3_9TRYP|nr:uncharacterized protein TM35_000411100 [Trypanosoma theileri]ORC84740.1 hypothetical protein TM35_000411100 [Trypanosoma theileri]
MSLNFDSYAASQRQRLDEIRRATEKERQLLALHAGRMSHSVDTSPTAPRDFALQQSASHESSRWLSLNDRAMEMHALDEQLTLEERDLDKQFFELDRRLNAAERRKTELLSQLTLLQHREALIKKQEEQLEEEETGAERETRLLETFAQEVDEEQRSHNVRVSEKRGRIDVAKTAARDQQKKRESLEARTRSHVDEIQDRIRHHRTELMNRTSALNDKERWLRQEELRIREEELSAIYRLRKEIESMTLSLSGGDATRQ